MAKKNNLSNYHQIGGVLYHIGNAINKGKKKSFYIKEFILEIQASRYGRTFSSFAKFEIKGEDKMRMTDPFEVGDPVVVTFTLDGRKWQPEGEEETVFNSLRVMGIEPMPPELTFEGEIEAGKKEKEEEGDSQYIIPEFLKDDEVIEDDDLPF